MSQVVGSVKSVSINGITYPVASDSDPSRDLGGLTTERMMNGDGTSRLKATLKPWKIEGLSVALDDADNSQENLQADIDSLTDKTIVITYVSGVAYGGTGNIEGDLTKSAQNGTADITLSGEGKLVKL